MSDTIRGAIERLYGNSYGNPYATNTQSIGAGSYDYQAPNTQPFLINPGSFQGDDQASRTAAATPNSKQQTIKDKQQPTTEEEEEEEEEEE